MIAKYIFGNKEFARLDDTSTAKVFSKHGMDNRTGISHHQDESCSNPLGDIYVLVHVRMSDGTVSMRLHHYFKDTEFHKSVSVNISNLQPFRDPRSLVFDTTTKRLLFQVSHDHDRAHSIYSISLFCSNFQPTGDAMLLYHNEFRHAYTKLDPIGMLILRPRETTAPIKVFRIVPGSICVKDKWVYLPLTCILDFFTTFTNHCTLPSNLRDKMVTRPV
jgi:hypothetical protein